MTYLNAICVSLDNAGLTDAAKNQNNCLKNNSSNHSGSEQLHIHSETHKQGVYILKKRHIKTHILSQWRDYKGSGSSVFACWAFIKCDGGVKVSFDHCLIHIPITPVSCQHEWMGKLRQPWSPSTLPLFTHFKLGLLYSFLNGLLNPTYI